MQRRLALLAALSKANVRDDGERSVIRSRLVEERARRDAGPDGPSAAVAKPHLVLSAKILLLPLERGAHELLVHRVDEIEDRSAGHVFCAVPQ